MADKSMAVREVGGVLVSVYSARNPTNEDWNEYLQLCRKHVARGHAKALAVTDGGGPDVHQRAATLEAVGENNMTAAVVSDARIVRGIVTALSWFNRRIRAFPFSNGAGIQDALTYLEVDVPADRILREVRAMQREIGAR
jgi:hypothetical protein